MKTISVILILLFLTSCESFIKYNGYVYDKENNPVTGANVFLIIQKDTIIKSGFEPDSISTEKRLSYRKSEIKDSLIWNVLEGTLIKPKRLFTDENGYFNTRTIWVGCVPKCPKTKLLIQKDNYHDTIIEMNNLLNDTLNIFLRK